MSEKVQGTDTRDATGASDSDTSSLVQVEDSSGERIEVSVALAPGHIEVCEVLYRFGFEHGSSQVDYEVARVNETTHVVSRSIEWFHGRDGSECATDIWLAGAVPERVDTLLEGLTEEDLFEGISERLGEGEAEPAWAKSKLGLWVSHTRVEHLSAGDGPGESRKTLLPDDVGADAQRLFERAAGQVASEGANVVATFEFAFLMVKDYEEFDALDENRLVVFCRVGPSNAQTHYVVMVGFKGMDESFGDTATGYLLPMTWVAREAFFESELPRLLDPPPRGGLLRSFPVVLDEEHLEFEYTTVTGAGETPADEAPALEAWRRHQDVERARAEEYGALTLDEIPF